MNEPEIHMLKFGDTQKWDDFVRRSENATFFHQAGWKSVVEEIYGHRPYYLYTEDDMGGVTGILPLFFINSRIFGKKMVSLPFAPYGGIITTREPETYALVTEAERLADTNSADYCELRCLHNDLCPGFVCMEGYSTFMMDLRKDGQNLWSEIGKKNRNMVRKAEKSGLGYQWKDSINDISEFYRVYSESVSALGTPVHSKSFFQAVYRNFPGDVSVAMVSIQEEPIASLLLLRFRDQVISGWGGSQPGSLEHAPNNLLYWQSILTAQKKGAIFFDFGRSLVGTGNYNFKRHWGAREQPLKYWYYPGDLNIRPPQEQYGLAARIWKKIPVFLNRRIGPMIRKYVV